MKYAMNISYLEKTVGLENAARSLSSAGFKLLDYTPRPHEKWEEIAKGASEIFEKYGLSVYQTHAPFNRYGGEDINSHKANVMNTLHAAARLGASYMVIHGDEFDFSKPYSPEAALEYNYNYFAPVVEEAKKLGVKVAFENVFSDIYADAKFAFMYDYKGPMKPRFCSYTQELTALIDRFGDEDSVCACWDFGHSAVSDKKKQNEAIMALGKRIECTHVHDNYLESDEHLVPFLGKIDWKACMRAVKETTKTEVLSLEMVYGSIQPSFVDTYSDMLFKICSELDSLA